MRSESLFLCFILRGPFFHKMPIINDLQLLESLQLSKSLYIIDSLPNLLKSFTVFTN
jgi:hypothetical protein